MRIEGVGPASCVASIPDRLLRIRGVEKVEIDADRGLVRVQLAREIFELDALDALADRTVLVHGVALARVA